MDFATIGLLTALVGVMVGLVRVIEYLILKKKNNGNGQLTPLQAEQLNGVSRFCTQFEIRWDYMKSDILTLKDEYNTLNHAMLKLANSQERVNEKMIELINKMDKFFERQ